MKFVVLLFLTRYLTLWLMIERSILFSTVMTGLKLDFSFLWSGLMQEYYILIKFEDEILKRADS